MPMPAVTLKQSTTQRSQNCGVRHAWSRATLALVIIFCGAMDGTRPAGFQSAAGTRTIHAPKIMKTNKSLPSRRRSG